MNELFPFYHIGHFINQPENPTAFEILLFEDMEEPEIDDVHRHTFYEILWVDEGESRQTIDYQTYELKEQSFFFISPGQVHEFEAWQPLRGGTILFTTDFFLLNQQNKNALFELSFLDNTYASPRLELSAGAFQEVRATIQLLLQEHRRPTRQEPILRSLLQVLLLQLQRINDGQQREPISKRNLIFLKQFQELIEQQFKSEWTVSDYAAHLSVTQHHLNRVSKTATGQTATSLIRARSILEAKRLLTFTDWSVGEIAAELGYFDSSYFAKIFRTDVQCSPSEFRSKMSEKYRK